MIWKHKLLQTEQDAQQALAVYKSWLDNGKVTASAYDTETTGLHPVVSVPFLFQCGFYNRETQHGWVYVVDIEHAPFAKPFIRTWNKLTERAPLYLGHHVIFDQHMTTNIGVMYNKWENMSDTQFYIRASSNARQEKEGGEPLALKAWAKKHISKDADKYEKELKAFRTKAAQQYNSDLLKRTGWKKKQFDTFFNDKTNDYTDLPKDIMDIYLRWFHELPEYLQLQVTGTVESDMIGYQTLPRDKVIEYGFYDIEYTLTCYEMCEPVVRTRMTYEQIRRENQQLRPLYEMERVGFLVDKEYLSTCQKRMKAYIKQRREDLNIIAGCPLKCGQHDKIKSILEETYGYTLESTGAEQLERLSDSIKHTEPDSDAIEFIDTILELRTLEKWYSTYIRKFEYQLKLSDRIYTSINQCGTVSGRVSCDFQQFPKKGLKSITGEELFDPRAMVITEPEYPAIVYLDYSAQELRVQALYTYLIGHPDYNMMRAYSPWKCHLADGTQYDPENPEHTKHAYDWVWYNDSDNQVWTPTDLHGAMTKTIFPTISESDPQFHDMRYVGKRTNFAKNYGASYTRIREMFPEFDEETCHRIDEAYYNTFPGVKEYHQACFRWAEQPCIDNLYGVKYYGVPGHNLRNMLVQGTSAYMTKDRIWALTNYMRDIGCKSKLVMQIHDEVQILWHKDDPPELMFEFKRIMQDIDSQVPIVSDMEVTFTTWKEKQEVSTLEELQTLCAGHRPIR